MNHDEGTVTDEEKIMEILKRCFQALSKGDDMVMGDVV